MKRSLLILVLVLLSIAVRAQDPIEDNSFLIEEAYNQEKGVIQYINTFYRTRGGDIAYSFTNEYPVKVQQHQFSYTINVVRTGGRSGLADTYINYRYQVFGFTKDHKAALAPRITLILPTGDYRKGTGAGAVGYQVNVPLSIKHSKKWVTHWNAGATVIPNAKNTAGDKATTSGVNLGQSTIFLLRDNFNLMFETVWNRNESVVSKKVTAASYSLLLNPGIRWAWNLKNGLQIVPGIAVPIGVGPSKGERGLFFYLSFER